MTDDLPILTQIQEAKAHVTAVSGQPPTALALHPRLAESLRLEWAYYQTTQPNPPPDVTEQGRPIVAGMMVYAADGLPLERILLGSRAQVRRMLRQLARETQALVAERDAALTRHAQTARS